MLTHKLKHNRAIAQMSMEEARLKQIKAAQEQRAARPQAQPQQLGSSCK